MCGIFISIEEGNFENNLSALLPTILQQFYDGFKENQPGMYVRVQQNMNDDESTASTMDDHHLYQLLLMLVKLTTYCPRILTNSAYTKDIETIACMYLFKPRLLNYFSFIYLYILYSYVYVYFSLILANAQKMLAHPHEWVRLSAAQLLGRIISVLKPEEIAAIANGDKPERNGFLLNDVKGGLKSFTLDHCYQLTPGVEVQEKLLMQVC